MDWENADSPTPPNHSAPSPLLHKALKAIGAKGELGCGRSQREGVSAPGGTTGGGGVVEDSHLGSSEAAAAFVA